MSDVLNCIILVCYILVLEFLCFSFRFFFVPLEMVCGAWLCVGSSHSRKPIWMPPWTWWPFIVVTGITVTAILRACINVLGLSASNGGALWFAWTSTVAWFAFAFLIDGRVEIVLGDSDYDLSQMFFGWPTMWMQAAIMETLERAIPEEGADLVLSIVIWFAVLMVTLATQMFHALHHRETRLAISSLDNNNDEDDEEGDDYDDAKQ